jgi:hypothetical protein
MCSLRQAVRRSVDTVNIAFGIVGVLSLIYAVWANRTAESAKRLSRRLNEEIKQLARFIYDVNQGTPTEGYARSIMQISDSILMGKTGRPEIGPLKMNYVAARMPPMQTAVGEVIDDPESRARVAVQGTYISPEKAALLYGPFDRLPLTGAYVVSYSLKAANLHEEVTGELVLMDVYDVGASRTLGSRTLSTSDLSETYQRFEVRFYCDDITRPVEYRVHLLKPGFTLTCDLISVIRKAD